MNLKETVKKVEGMAEVNANYAIELNLIVISEEERLVIERLRKRDRFFETEKFFRSCDNNTLKENRFVLWFAEKFGERQTLDRGTYVAEIRQSFGKQYLI